MNSLREDENRLWGMAFAHISPEADAAVRSVAGRYAFTYGQISDPAAMEPFTYAGRMHRSSMI